MLYLAITVLEDLVIDELIGPFDSAGEAMTYADVDALKRMAENPGLVRESDDEVIMLVTPGDDDEVPTGFIYQVIEAKPAVVTASPESEET